MTVTAAVEATLGTSANAYVAPQTVVALPPSDLDPGAGQMRAYVGGVLTVREYDTVLEQP